MIDTDFFLININQTISRICVLSSITVITHIAEQPIFILRKRMANHFAIFYPRAFGFFAKELENR